MQSALSNLPVGWGFHPTNLELLDHYLKKKRLGHPIHGSDIQDIQICDFDPWELLDQNCRDKERYVFCRRQFQMKTGGNQRKRKAKGGFWKRTGEIQTVTLEDRDEVIGKKTIFVYHDPEPTDYVKHEFEYTAELDSPVQDGNDFVLCKLLLNTKKKANKKPRKGKSLSKEKQGNKPKKEGNKPETKVDCEKTKTKLDCRNTKPNKKARKGLPFCDTELVSVSDQQKQEKIMDYNSAYGEGEPSIQKTSVFEYQSNMMTYSVSGEGECIQSQNPYEITVVPTNKKGEQCCLTDFDSETRFQNEMISQKYNHFVISDFDDQNQNPSKITDLSASLQGKEADNLENQIPLEMTYMSSNEMQYPGRYFWTKLQNPNKRTFVLTNEKRDSSCLTDFDFENRNQDVMISQKGKPSYLFDASDFVLQNPSERPDILTSLEGKWYTPGEAHSDFGKQNRCESQYKGTHIPSLDDIEMASFPEINSEILYELTAMDDLKDTLCSETTQPPHTKESLVNCGLGASMSA